MTTSHRVIATTLLVVLVAVSLLQLVSALSKKTLVVIDDTSVKSSHSQFLESLTKRGYQLEFKTARDPTIRLEQYGEYSYHNLIILAPETDRTYHTTHHFVSSLNENNEK